MSELDPKSPESGADGSVEAAMDGDPIDLLVRRSMRELDSATPAGYFEALPQRVEGAIDSAIAAGFVGMDDDEAPAGERARRTSSQGLDFGPDLGGRERRARRTSTGELRKTNPPLEGAGAEAESVENRELRQTARPRRATDSRAYRRSLLQTQVGAPEPWWQRRAVVLSVAGVAVAGLVAVAVVRWTGNSASSSDQLGASSSRLPPRPSPRPSDRVTAPSDAAAPPTEDQVQLRRQLAKVLPAARACFAAPPLDEVALAVTIDAGGAVRALSVRGGNVAERERQCVIEAVRDEVEAASWISGGARTIAVPLFE